MQMIDNIAYEILLPLRLCHLINSFDPHNNCDYKCKPLLCTHARMQRNNQFYYRAILQFCNREGILLVEREREERNSINLTV